MKIDKDTVDKIAHLARLEVTDTEREELIGEYTRFYGQTERGGYHRR